MAFTRRGDLGVSEAGFLVTGNGKLVAGEGGGPITVPADGTVNITPDGTVFFTPGGDEVAVAQPVGNLLIRDASAVTLVRRTDGLFEVEGSDGAGGDFPNGPNTASVDSGSLEGANVNAVEVMVNLLDFYRSFETQMKVIKSSEEMDKDGSKLMRRISSELRGINYGRFNVVAKTGLSAQSTRMTVIANNLANVNTVRF